MKKILSLIMFLVYGVGPVVAAGAVEGSINMNGATKVGQSGVGKIVINSNGNPVSSLSLSFKFDSTKVKISKVDVNKNLFDSVLLNSVSSGLVNIYVVSLKKESELPKGVLEVATFDYQLLAEGSFEMALSNYEIVGPSATGAQNYTAVWPKTVVNITGSEVNVDNLLKFKVAFSGVDSSAVCAKNWPVDVVVMNSSGQTKVYTGVVLSSNFEGEVDVSSLGSTTGLAAFIKGPKHLSVKYGENNQTSYFNQEKGNLSAGAAVNDFSKFPILVGDVNRDGVVDGVDFSIVKADTVKRTSGTNMLSDLNGNCQLESLDLVQLMLAMKDKMEQLY